LFVWATSGAKKLGGPHLHVIMEDRVAFDHKHPQSTIVGCTHWVHLPSKHMSSTHPLRWTWKHLGAITHLGTPGIPWMHCWEPLLDVDCQEKAPKKAS
jgi:hypothetical protein